MTARAAIPAAAALRAGRPAGGTVKGKGKTAMIYKFKSKATGDLIMMGPNGDAMLRAAGREPAAQGIFEVEHMPAALTALEAAIAQAEAERAQAEAEAAAEGRTLAPAEGVGLRARLFPMIEMLRRAQAAGEPVVWGV